jgi:hypothetical protein
MGRESGMENRESAKRPHERLEVWRDAMDLVEAVYRFSAGFPDAERSVSPARCVGLP